RLVYQRGKSSSYLWRLSLGTRGAPPVRLAPPSLRVDELPQYSPDGKRLAFASDRGGGKPIWLSDSDASKAMQLAASEGAGVRRRYRIQGIEERRLCSRRIAGRKGSLLHERCLRRTTDEESSHPGRSRRAGGACAPSADALILRLDDRNERHLL